MEANDLDVFVCHGSARMPEMYLSVVIRAIRGYKKSQ